MNVTIEPIVMQLVTLAAAVTAVATIWVKVIRPVVHGFREIMQIVPVITSIAKQFDNNGGNSLRDVIDKMSGKVALLESDLYIARQRERTIFSMMPIGVSEADADGSFVYVSNAFCQASGLTAEKAVGNGWMTAVHEDDREEVIAEWEACVAKHREFDMEFRFRTPEGRVSYVHGRSTVIRDRQGRVAQFVGTVEIVSAHVE